MHLSLIKVRPHCRDCVRLGPEQSSSPRAADILRMLQGSLVARAEMLPRICSDRPCSMLGSARTRSAAMTRTG